MGWCVVLIWWSGFERILHSGFVGMRVSNGATNDSMSVQNSVEVRGEMGVCLHGVQEWPISVRLFKRSSLDWGNSFFP